MTATAPRGKTEAATYAEVPVALIDTADNVRSDLGDLADLSASIAVHGVQQPIRVTVQGDRYRLVWGHRRLAAAQIAGLSTIPSLVTEQGPSDGLARTVSQLVENIQRLDLNPLDQAEALRRIMAADPGLTEAALGAELGKSESWVSNTLRLLEASEPVRKALSQGQISVGHAKAMLAQPDEDQQALLEFAMSGANVRDVERQAAFANERRKEQQEREAATAEGAKQRATAAIAALNKKKVPKATTVYLSTWHGNADETKIIAAAIRKAGWSIGKANASRGRKADALDCDCAAVEVEVYDKMSIKQVCENDAHREAKRQADTARYESEKARDAEVRHRVAALTAEGLAFKGPNGRLLANILFYHLMDYRLAEFAKNAHGDAEGKPKRPWEYVVAMEDHEVAAGIATELSRSIGPRNGVAFPWSDLAEALGIEIEPPAEAPAPRKRTNPKRAS